MKKTIKEERIKEIQDVALKLFSEKGYENTNLDEIAEKVNVTKPTIYLYFKNKEDLFSSAIKERLKKMQDSFDEIMKTQLSSIEKLKKYMEIRLNFFDKNKETFKLIHQLRANLITKNKKNIKQDKHFLKNYKDHIEKLSKLLDKCISDGYLKENDSLFLAFSLSGLLSHIILYKYTFDINDLDSLTKKCFDIFICGAGTQKLFKELKNEK